jgi:phosphatidylglycerol:prolipoprotein diacylglycerol transferase
LFPYIDVTRWHWGSFALHPFVALIAIAIAVGYFVAVHRAKLYGIGREHFTQLGLCVIAAAFIGGHLAKFIYSPESWRMIFIQPAILFHLLTGQASFGAFIGGYLAALLFLFFNRISYWDSYLYADAACFALPFAWWIGRAGCYLVHDHPGVRTTSFLGVQYPGGTRYDLGLLEALFLIALSLVFLLLDSKPRPRGFFYAAFLFSYGTFRFFLDRLHIDPPRYGGFTVDQIAAGLLILGGVITTLELNRLKRARLRIMSSSEVA